MNKNLLSQSHVILSNISSEEFLEVASQYFKIPSDEYLLFYLKGSASQTLDDFLSECSQVFQFPEYFGNNLDSLDECLSDLSWLEFKGICVFIDESNLFLCNEENHIFENVISIFSDIGQEWSEPIKSGEEWDKDATPIHFIFRRVAGRIETFGLPEFA